MKYLNNLKWQTHIELFDPDEQRLMLALSHQDFKWRTRERLLTVTGLAPEILDSKLSTLISKDLVRPSFSKNKYVIFGLRERVG